ncbi:MAG: hypothetical protein AAF357_01690, partial [Verrucomicrobiota bacterium]
VSLAILPNFQKKTHGATSASSIRAGESAITANLITGGELGDGFDGLITAVTTGVIPEYVGETAAAGFQVETLDAAKLGALAELGITEIYLAAGATLPADTNATLEGHDYSVAATALTATSTVAGLGTDSIAAVADDFNLDTAPDDIFAFGLGQESTLVGLNRAFKEAPLHTPGEGSAATTYARYAILVGFEAASGEAFYIGMTCIDDGENFNNISNNLGEFFEASS